MNYTEISVCIALTQATESFETVRTTSVLPLRYFLVCADS